MNSSPSFNPDQIKAIVTDLDGTLLNNKSDVSDYTRDVIARARKEGYLFGICTGRPAAGIKKLLEKWGLLDEVDFAIAFNGGTFVDLQNDQHTSDTSLEPGQIAQLIRHFKKYNPNFLEYQGGELLGTKKDIPSFFMARRNGLDSRTVQADELLIPAQKLMLTGMPWKISKILRENKDLKYVNMFRSGPFLIEILHPDLSKKKGIEKIEARYSLRPEQILSFGNDNNDKEMLEYSTGVAMKNALEEIQQAAGRISEYTNDQDGVAHYLEDHLLKNATELTEE